MKCLRVLSLAVLAVVLVCHLAGCSGRRGARKEPVDGKPVEGRPSGKTKPARTADLLDQARAAMDRGALAEARKLAANALEQDPRSARARLFLGQIDKADGRFDSAVKHLDAALELDRQSVVVRRALGETLDQWAQQAVEADDPEAAIKRWQRCLELNHKKALTNRQLAEAYRRAAQKARDARRLIDAESNLLEAVARMPENPVIRLDLGRVYLEADRLTEAQRSLKALVEDSPSFIEGRVAYVEALIRAGDTRAAQLQIDEIQARVPDHPAAQKLAAQLAAGGAPAVARVTPAAAGDGAGPSPEMTRKLAALDASGDLAGQIKLLQPLAEQGAGAPWAQLALARVLEKAGRADAATRWIERYLEARPDDHRARFFLARCLQIGNQLERALAILEELRQDGHGNLQIYDELGQIYAKKGRFDDARRAWEKALELDPQYPGALFNFAQLAMEQGHNDEARELFSRALAVDPFNLKVYYFAGLNLKQAGDVEAARRVWLSTRAFLNPQDPYGARIKAALGEQVAEPAALAAVPLPSDAPSGVAPVTDPASGDLDPADPEVSGPQAGSGEAAAGVAAVPVGVPGSVPPVDPAAGRMPSTIPPPASPLDGPPPVVGIPSAGDGSAPRTPARAGGGSPLSDDPEYQSALAAARNGQFEEALAGFRQLEGRYPNNTNLQINLGNVHLARQEFAEAAIRYLGVLSREPGHGYAAGNLVQAYRQLGLAGPAAEVLRTQAESRINEGNLVVSAAEQLIESGRNRAAVRLLDQLESNPDPDIRQRIGKLRERVGANPVDRPAPSNPRAYEPMVRAMLAAGMTASAVELARTGAAEHPDNPGLLALYGDTQRQVGDLTGAQNSYRRIVELEKTNPLGYFKQGELLMASGRQSEALAQFRSASQAREVDAATLLELVPRFRQLGDVVLAGQLIERLKGMNLSVEHAARLAQLGAAGGAAAGPAPGAAVGQ